MKVLIIDDEPNVREGLKMIVPWEILGFTICGEGKDGLEGLQKILIDQPDLVLIDIKMPGMSGIAVIEEAIKQGFSGKFIITTGYSDFEYAKKAMKLGVQSYVLKPIDEDELIDEIRRLKNDICKAHEMRNKLDAGESYLKHQEFLQLLTCDYEELISKSSLIHSKNEHYISYYMVLIKVFTEPHQLGELAEDIKRYLGSLVKECSIFNEEIILILDGNKSSNKMLEGLHEKIRQRYGLESLFGVSSRTEGIEHIHSTYMKTKSLLDLEFIFPEQYILEEADRTLGDLEIIEAEALSDQLYQLVQVGDLKKIHELLENSKKQLAKNLVSKQKIVSLCTQVLIRCIQLIEGQYKVHQVELTKGEVIIESIYKSSNIEEVMYYMYQELAKCCKQITQKAPENTMDKILYYISNNYNKEVKLETLAELFNYNSAYLGKSFKNYTGEGFNIYIDRLRISKAKELLLNEEMKVYEISKAVGYKHIDYFHSKFKKYVGISPLEYRKSRKDKV